MIRRILGSLNLEMHRNCTMLAYRSETSSFWSLLAVLTQPILLVVLGFTLSPSYRKRSYLHEYSNRVIVNISAILCINTKK